MKLSSVFHLLAILVLCLNITAQSQGSVRLGLQVTAITPDDNYSYWYGYYDKLLMDPSQRYVLSMRTNTVNRTPGSDDVVEVGMTDLKDRRKWISLGKSAAWGWQQGCMLQFIPGSAEEVIWNDREGDRYIARIVNIRTKKTRTLPRPVYTIAPDGKWALGLDFSRLQTRRPGYGYAGANDTTLNMKVPPNVGIYRIDLRTGQSVMLVTLEQITAVPIEGYNVSDYYHWVNHLLINPAGDRFIFLHRWHKDPSERFYTRMFTADKNGKDLYMLDPSGFTSHFVWRDDNHVAMFTRPAGMKGRFYLFKDKSREVNIIGEDKMTLNGHNTYVNNTGNEWILNDTYPDKQQRLQTLYLYNERGDERIDIGKFAAPEGFDGEWRCDLHPWSSPDGKKAFFQSAHEGKRRVYMVDIAVLTGK